MKTNEAGWSIAEGTHEGKPVIIRFRDLNQSFPRSKYPQRLNIFWTFAAPTTQGLPSSEDSSQAKSFEDRLINSVEGDGHSILSTVLTGKGQREFVFHTPEVKEFLRRLTEMPQEQKRYPIEVGHTEDPDWDYVNRVLRDMQK
ncbi:MAG TPA: DUF695 domain-containing protein [Chthoniobacteraceae bacterium]|jgi:hypothetical protein|nr:DUF695 domain-containing protein [Chthoniobacteraceae bacterium]